MNSLNTLEFKNSSAQGRSPTIALRIYVATLGERSSGRNPLRESLRIMYGRSFIIITLPGKQRHGRIVCTYGVLCRRLYSIKCLRTTDAQALQLP